MNIVSWDSFVTQPLPFEARSATVGVFDGLHLGHRALIDRILTFDATLSPSVFTFLENPKEILRPKDFDGNIFSLDQKLDAFEKLGVALTVLIDFSGNFGKLSGKDFVDLLKDRGKLRYLAVGSDFRCGYRLDTDAERIRSLNEADGIPTDIVTPVLWGGMPVSSSRIRTAIAAGNLVEATALLGRSFVLDLGSASTTPDAASVEYDVGSTRRITPPNGRYPVIVKNDFSSLGTECEIEIDRGRVRVPARIGVVKYVEFIR
ncbi:MAG: FAD synthetase family protein [Treponemataceae bacterium]